MSAKAVGLRPGSRETVVYLAWNVWSGGGVKGAFGLERDRKNVFNFFSPEGDPGSTTIESKCLLKQGLKSPGFYILCVTSGFELTWLYSNILIIWIQNWLVYSLFSSLLKNGQERKNMNTRKYHSQFYFSKKKLILIFGIFVYAFVYV